MSKSKLKKERKLAIEQFKQKQEEEYRNRGSIPTEREVTGVRAGEPGAYYVDPADIYAQYYDLAQVKRKEQQAYYTTTYTTTEPVYNFTFTVDNNSAQAEEDNNDEKNKPF